MANIKLASKGFYQLKIKYPHHVLSHAEMNLIHRVSIIGHKVEMTFLEIIRRYRIFFFEVSMMPSKVCPNDKPTDYVRDNAYCRFEVIMSNNDRVPQARGYYFT